MDQLSSAHVKPPAAIIPAQATTPEALYDSGTESLTLQLNEPCRSPSPDMKTRTESDNEASGTEDENHKYSTVLLENRRKKSRWLSFCPSYRSADPDRSVTPFAVVLLAVLFIIYILNQADRLVLPVAIPSGLRCEGGRNDCRNLTHVAAQDDVSTLTGLFADSESPNETFDCIHFNDYEQGLLTGWLGDLHIVGTV